MSPGPDPIALAEQGIQKLRVEFEKFFSGVESVPPEALRQSVETQIRNLKSANLTGVESFRASSVEARFNSYSEMFARRLRRIEEGRPIRPRKAAIETNVQARTDPRRGVCLDQELEHRGVEALYRGLYGNKGAVEFDSFRDYLAKNLAAIRQRTGCNEAEFRLVHEDGKAKLKVKPLAASRAAQGKE